MNFLKLDVWHRSPKLSIQIYKHFSDFRDYGFKDQITRSSLSIPSNIAEGTERKSDKDTRHFYNIAKSSCGELFTQIYVGIEIGCIEKHLGEKWSTEAKELSTMLGGLIKRINSQTHINS